MAQQQLSSGGSSGRRATFELWGLLRPVKTGPKAATTTGGEEEEEEEEYDDDDDDSEFLDSLFEDSVGFRSRPERRTVIIQDEISPKEYEVVGRFPWIDPWWKVNVKVKQGGSKYYMQGYPSYFLQTDPVEKEVFRLFFTACKVPLQFQDAFLKWFEEREKLPLSFIHLEEKLNCFKKSEFKEGQTTDNSNDIFRYIKNSCTGKAVLVALVFPIILEFLPKLLPNHVLHCIEWMGNKGDGSDKLAKLDTILKEEPWKLGFSTILSNDLHVYLGEASWKSFRECRCLLEKIPDLQKNALKLYAKLQQRCREMGHTYEEENMLTQMVSEDMSVEQAWQSIQFMKDEEIVITERRFVFLRNLYKSEKGIASIVYELIQKTPWQLHADVKKVLNRARMNNSRDPVVEGKIQDEESCHVDLEEKTDVSDMQDNDGADNVTQTNNKEISEAELDPDQENAIALICSNPVTVISGKGGCGKTSVVTSLFQYLDQMEEEETRNACRDFEADLDASEEWNSFSHYSNLNKHRNESLNILFTAPTGRAAGLLREKTNLPAYTLHQVIGSYKAWAENGGETPWKFSKINVLVVDEGSLVSVSLLSTLLHCLFYNSKLAKLIILGDVRQLPSIDPGNMLSDIFESLKPRGWSVELRTNHRTESQLIVDNATRISHQIYPEFDAVLSFSEHNKTWPMPSPDNKFIFIALPAEDGSNYLQSAVKTLLERGPGLENAEQSQFLAFRRKDCDLINELCCKHHSDHLTRDHKRRLWFQCNDKICCTRNAYLHELHAHPSIPYIDNKGPQGFAPCNCMACLKRRTCDSGQEPLEETEKRLCNGEIFFITEDYVVDKYRFLTIRSTDDYVYTIPYRNLLRECKIKHAWARTIHTFQGSEEKTVVYVVGNAGRQHWQHVYTAVTRGRCRVYIVAEEAELRRAIRSKCIPRKTHLRQHFKKALERKTNYFEQTSPRRNWQSHKSESRADFTSHAGNHFTNNKEPAVSDMVEDGNEWRRSAELADAAEDMPPPEGGGTKRQNDHPIDCLTPPKVALITEDNSPLGITKLQNMTLKSPVTKQLFPQ